jgi:hypothetical protein
MKNGVFWVVTQCGSCNKRRFGGTWRLLHQGNKNPKRWFLQEPHGVTTQKTPFFAVYLAKLFQSMVRYARRKNTKTIDKILNCIYEGNMRIKYNVTENLGSMFKK